MLGTEYKHIMHVRTIAALQSYNTLKKLHEGPVEHIL